MKLFLAILLFLLGPDAFAIGVVGSYEVQLQAGATLFHDHLRVLTATRQPGMGESRQSITGVYEVPGVFEAELEDGIIDYSMRDSEDSYELTFHFTPKERGADYPVYVRVTGRNFCEARGRAYLDVRSQKSLGELVLHGHGEGCDEK